MTIAKAAPRPDPDGYYGEFGGRFVAETLVAAIEDLDRAYRHHREDKTFLTEYHETLRTFVGRPAPSTTPSDSPATTAAPAST